MSSEIGVSSGETFERGTRIRGGDAAFIVPDRVPDISIDGFEGALGVNGLLRLNLVRFRIAPDTGKTVREVVATLSMTSATANSFTVALVDALNKQGMLSEDAPVAVASSNVATPETVR